MRNVKCYEQRVFERLYKAGAVGDILQEIEVGFGF